jgi:hypothetical protein
MASKVFNMSQHSESHMTLYIGKALVISENLKGRILSAYPSEALAQALEDNSEQSLYILSQLVWMSFNAERVLVLAQKKENKAIAKICKECLEGQSLLNELQRVILSEPLH